MAAEVLRPEALDARERYQLLTSLVVPRPIGWISTWDDSGRANLAPFSFYTALASSPMLVGVSVGHRGDQPKDSLRNARASRAFCVNVVTEEQLVAMHRTAGEFGPEVDEFERADLKVAPADAVSAPFVADCPAVLECSVHREVELGEAAATLLVGRVEAVRLDPRLRTVPGTRYVDAESLRPVGRLHGRAYGLLGEVVFVDRADEE
ncbi:MAG: flavin reductase family protein [Gemmatimonadetes bacterium]|nr:flavin reductase family protein [Gemmatimonadota bacterium]NIR80028.1 flavin reductase family protein [Gemmatimonadota bacterium]NIT88763.1 flavin reductase family protein [Gemmatimonadota bacterium]NIU32570.1 flavin reductase family protein [Gemmatimonadota bacterium]NIU37028.1 flavin reductase family protein [Gemmatimonadota bacterium]